jgi:hypothetical protein
VGVGLSEELRDPWALVAGGVLGGMGWAVTASILGPPAIAVGLGVGAAVLGAKALTGLVLNRDQPKRTPAQELPRPPRGSAAGQWLARAESAVRSLQEMAGTSAPGMTGSSVRSAADEAAQTLVEMSQVAGQVTAIERALARVDVQGLDLEAARLDAAVDRATSPEVRAENVRAAAAVRDRIDVRDRLLSARETLLARMQAVALGLEGLGARLAEVLALGTTAGDVDPSPAQIDQLTMELEGLRAGLAETEALSRRALEAAPTEGS